MKTIPKFLLTAFLIMAMPVLITAQKQNKTTETVKYITSIDCDNCVNKIMTNLPHDKGIKDVKCDLPSKTVTVTFRKDKNDPEKIKRAIEKLGFTAQLATSDNTEKKDK